MTRRVATARTLEGDNNVKAKHLTPWRRIESTGEILAGEGDCKA
jgi:hypothetical protein